jgi:hypothetical protein
LSRLQNENRELSSQLEDERRKVEDLQFRFEEEAITKCDVEVGIYTIIVSKMACEFYHQVIADSLNNYFLSVAEKINTNNICINRNADKPLSNYDSIDNNHDTNNYNPIHHLSQAFNNLFTNIN